MPKRPSISAAGYTRVCQLALVLLCVIVVSGAAVRLSNSGLGCSDWPRCNEKKFVDISSLHGAIEQVNRLFTGFVTVAVMLAVLAAIFRVPKRMDLIYLSWGLVLGVLGQIILGGIVVLTDLHPLANQGHFVLSMILVGNALILLSRSKWHDGQTRQPSISPNLRLLVRLVVLAGTVAILTGTLVTGSGPHAGDENARRFGFSIFAVAKLHGSSVIVMLLAALLLAFWASRDSPARKIILGPLEIVLVVGVLQAGIGYVQYFNGIPALLVGLHIAGATLFFLSLINLWLHTSHSVAESRAIVAR